MRTLRRLEIHAGSLRGSTCSVGKRAHSSVQPGNAAAKNAKGEFLHEAVRKYLFTHPVDHVGAAVSLAADCGEKLPKF